MVAKVENSKAQSKETPLVTTAIKHKVTVPGPMKAPVIIMPGPGLKNLKNDGFIRLRYNACYDLDNSNLT